MKHAKGCDAPPEKPTISSTFSGRKKMRIKADFCHHHMVILRL